MPRCHVCANVKAWGAGSVVFESRHKYPNLRVATWVPYGLFCLLGCFFKFLVIKLWDYWVLTCAVRPAL